MPDSAIGHAAAEAVALTCDLTAPASVGALFAEVEGRFGRLDLLFNMFGVSAPPTKLEDVAFDDWRAVLENRAESARRLSMLAHAVSSTL